jgi:hypothetical protein
MIPRSLFYIVAVMLAGTWALAFFVWHASNLVHIMLVLALVSFFLGLANKKAEK